MPPKSSKHDITEIVDAFGNWHDLSKHSFDAVGGIGGEAIAFGSALLQGDFKDRAEQILGAFKDEAAAGFGAADSAADMAANMFGSLAGAAAGWLAGQSTAVAVGAESLAGPAGVAVAILGTVVTDWAKKQFRAAPKEVDQESGHKPGAWIVIDNGDKTVKVKAVRAALAWGATQMFGDAPERADYDLMREEDYSTGFVVDPTASDKPGYMQVFNFATENEELRHFSTFRLLPTEIAAKLDANPALSLIREARFRRDSFEVEVLLAGKTSTDPGTEVVDLRDGFRKTIVRASGEQMLLEDGSGQIVVATLADVAPGRTDSNISYNYLGQDDKGLVVAAGFKDPTAEGLYKGRWVWTRPTADAFRISREAGFAVRRSLAVVVAMLPRREGETFARVQLFEAWSGDKIVREQIDCVPAGFEAEEFLNSSTTFKSFKYVAIEGHASVASDRAPGRFHLANLCLGLDESTIGPGEGSWVEAAVGASLKRASQRAEPSAEAVPRGQPATGRLAVPGTQQTGEQPDDVDRLGSAAAKYGLVIPSGLQNWMAGLESLAINAS